MEEGRSGELEIEELHPDRTNSSLQGSWLCCIPCYWLRRNNRVEKTLLTVATLLVSILLVASPVIFLISSVPGNRGSLCAQDCWMNERKKCLDEECQNTERRLLASLAHDRDPCYGFYEFACAAVSTQIEHRNLVSDQDAFIQQIQHQLTVAANVQPFQKLAAFFKTCIRADDKTTSFTPMLGLLKELGGYVPPEGSIPSDLTTLLVRLMKINGMPLFQIRLQSESNKSQLISVIDSSKDFPREWQLDIFRTQKISANSFWETFLKIRMAIVGEMLLEMMPEGINDDKRMAEVRDISLFVSELSKLQRSTHAMTEGNVATITNIQKQYTFVHWNQVFRKLYNLELSSHDLIYDKNPRYMESINSFINSKDPRIVHNGLLVIYATDFLYPLVNTSIHSDWPKFCTKLMMQLFSEPLTALILHQYPPSFLGHLIARASSTFDALKRTIELDIKVAPWLDEQLRNTLLSKLAKLKIHLLSTSRNDSQIFAELHSFRIDQEDFLGGTLRRNAQIFSSSSPGFQEIESLDFNSFINTLPNYDKTSNKIVVPLSLILQSSFKEHIPKYFLYSSVGQALSQAIIYVVISTVKENAISTSVMAKLNETVSCAGNESFGAVNQWFADSIAIDVAYKTWSKERNPNEALLPSLHYTDHQLYFILAAQAYCIEETSKPSFGLAQNPNGEIISRVNKMMRNSPYFSKVFTCFQLTSTHQCELW